MPNHRLHDRPVLVVEDNNLARVIGDEQLPLPIVKAHCGDGCWCDVCVFGLDRPRRRIPDGDVRTACGAEGSALLIVKTARDRQRVGQVGVRLLGALEA